MAWFFALSLPGLVVLIIIGGLVQLIFFRRRRRARPGAASVGFNLLDLALRPGREHLYQERESKRLFRKEAEDGAPPRNKVDLTNRTAKISRKAPSQHGADDQTDEESQ